MNIEAIARDSERLTDMAAERTPLELAGNDLLVGNGELWSGPHARVASFAKHAQGRQVIATPHKSVRLWNSATVSELESERTGVLREGWAMAALISFY